MYSPEPISVPDSEFTWTDGTPYDFQAWAPGEPNDDDGSELCVEMYIENAPGLWNDHLCFTSRHYVCKTEMGNTTYRSIFSSNNFPEGTSSS